jgi:hypothetical protein
MSRRTLALAVALGALGALGSTRRARAIDRNFAGSAQLDYHLVPHADGELEHPKAFDGATTEVALKLVVDFSPHLSANVKVCYGCHGFEADMAFVDYRVADELAVRFGRFSPSFGAFNLRHDPANHHFSDKPLPYDMGRMLRMRDWNLGVLPSPFPDNGAELNGSHWFGERVQLDYAAYAVSGFKAGVGALDLDFTASRSPSAYYVENNARPTVGARAALTVKLSQEADVTIGASAMGGTYDPRNELAYAIVGADAALRVGRTSLRAEWLARRQQFDVSDPTRLKYAIGGDAGGRGEFFVRHGAYLELEQPLASTVDLLVRVDGLLQHGNVAASSPLVDGSSVMRATLGTSWAVERGLRLKLSTELWRFSEKDASGRSFALTGHLGAAASF